MQPLCTVNDDFDRTIMTKLTLTDGKISGAKVDALVLASTAGEDGATLAEGAALPKNAAAYLTEHLSATGASGKAAPTSTPGADFGLAHADAATGADVAVALSI